MKNIIPFLCALTVFGFSGCGRSAKIDYRMNVAGPDNGNYFNWSAGSANVKDGFDPSAPGENGTTGASRGKSTSRFDAAVTYDIPSNAAKHTGYALPGGLRGLFLYPVASDDTRTNDQLSVTANGKELTIHYIHRDSAYEIKTDTAGKLDVTTAVKVARGVCSTEDQHTFTLKPEFSKTGSASPNMGDFDWTKAVFTPDRFSDNATRHYTGSLDTDFAGNILTIKGSLKEVK
ncbi:MAG: hypothetical protein LBK25_05475 [Treponema sp.]|jgi:hypothetical protein|nr:hypothetical protein [Treponema sp.]